MYPKIITVFATLLYFLTGCASFPKHEVAEVTDFHDVSGYTDKPSAFFDFRFFRGEPDAEKPVELISAKQHTKPIIESAIEESGYFSEYTFDEVKKADMDYTVRVDVYNHGNPAAAFIGGFVSGFTFGVIPAFATDNYTLVLKAVDERGDVIHEESNNDAMRTWVGIWFIPAMGNTPQEALEATLKNQMLDGLNKLVQSDVLRYSLNEFRGRDIEPVNLPLTTERG